MRPGEPPGAGADAVLETRAQRGNTSGPPTSSGTVLAFENVAKRFQSGAREVVAIDDVSLEVRQREFVAIIGPSGCGKSTLLRMAAGLSFPTEGRVLHH